MPATSDRQMVQWSDKTVCHTSIAITVCIVVKLNSFPVWLLRRTQEPVFTRVISSVSPSAGFETCRVSSRVIECWLSSTHEQKLLIDWLTCSSDILSSADDIMRPNNRIKTHENKWAGNFCCVICTVSWWWGREVFSLFVFLSMFKSSEVLMLQF